MANRLLTFARLAHQVATETLPERAHRFAPKRYSQPQLLACLLVKEYLGLDYRTAQEALEISDGLREALALTVVPDYTTLWRFAHDKATADVVAGALVETVRLLKASGHDPPTRPLVAIDSTGLFCGHASRYFEHRARRERRQRTYQKWAAAPTHRRWVEDGPAARARSALEARPLPSRGRGGGDYPDLPPLAEASVAAVSDALILADAGYDGESNHVFCRERLGVQTLIPAKTRRYVAGPRRPYRAEMVHALGRATLGVDGQPEPRRTYRQRWLVETLMSVVKRKWGEALSARLPSMEQAQALLRGLVYNLYRLVGLGVQPTLAAP